MDRTQELHKESQQRRKMRNKLKRTSDPMRLLQERTIRINDKLVKCDGVRALMHYSKIRADRMTEIDNSNLPQSMKYKAKRKHDHQHLWQNREDKTAGQYLEKDEGVDRMKTQGSSSVSRKALTAYTLEKLGK